MRLLPALLLAIVALPVQAAGWGHYGNVWYGYGIDIPPGFVGQGESGNGDGQVFKLSGATLTVFGANIVEGDFETEVAQRQRFAQQAGWAITYQVSTPTRASFSGKQGGQILYTRMVAACGGTQFALFQLTYGSASIAAYTPIVDRLVASLQPATGGRC
jgi:hypothetical protein